MHRWRVFLVLGAVLLAGQAAPAAAAEFTIGYLQLERDARYGRKRAYARYLTQALGRPYTAATVALREIRFHGAQAGVTFDLERVRAADAAAMVTAVDEMAARGVRLFVVDAPAETLAALAAGTKGKDLVLFNVSAREDRLRETQCQAHLYHVIPSYAMLMDALAQYLVSRKWRQVLMLVGPLDEDAHLAAAFERAAKRFGLKINARRAFVLSNDPRQRDQSNVALLSADADYDVVFVADTDGEFARDVPYHTLRPRPVVGSEGLAAAAWHWAWERHGAPQLEKRFEAAARRSMRSVDWAAWMAVKTVGAVVQQTGSADFATLRDALNGPDLILDAFKGNRVNFRPWNRQLRQPVLLITHNWVVERAPIEGFLHHRHDLDSLGVDEGESRCRP